MKLTVSSLLRYLKQKLDSDAKIQSVVVAGELSNVHRHHSGHLYFSLKDEFSCINCVMFKTAAQTLQFEPKNGDQVLLKANTSIFEVSGQLQLYVTLMKLDGVGDLYQRYEELKKKLANEGYFNPSHKKEVPLFSMSYAVLVGDHSAAMSDIKTTFKRRWPIAKVDYYPVLVQGSSAASNIIETLLKVDELNYDVIILARGGGSFEDLFCFNDETLVKAIYGLNSFIVTGIGHEQDFTLADFVADLRAPTPTAAVELTTAKIDELALSLNQYEVSLKRLMMQKIELQKKRLLTLNERKVLKDGHTLLEKSILKLEFFNTKLYNSVSKFKNLNHELIQINTQLQNALEKKLFIAKTNLKRNGILLEAYGLNKTLKRGYTYITQDQKLIKKKVDLKRDEKFEIHFADGVIEAKGV